jgi:anti-sigma regulatory factor (Ser/Thr protein kinase)
MRLSDWIKLQIDALRSMIVPDEPPPVPPDGVAETPHGDGVIMRFQSSTANLSRVRKSIERFCETTQLDQPARDEIGLVVNEALANVIRHAYSNAQDKPIELLAERHHGGVRFHIRDWGNGEDPTHHHRTDRDPLVPGGLGLICMKRLMDEAKFIPQPHGHGMVLEMIRTTNGSLAAKVDHPSGA